MNALALSSSSRKVPPTVQDHNTELRLVWSNNTQRGLESRMVVVNLWFFLAITRFPATQSMVSPSKPRNTTPHVRLKRLTLVEKWRVIGGCFPPPPATASVSKTNDRPDPNP